MSRALGLAFWLVVVAVLLAALGPGHGPLVSLIAGDPEVARVDGSSVRQREVAQALREHLWRQGEAWSALAPAVQQQRREMVLQQIIDQRLLRTARLEHPAPLADGVVSEELLQFQRQLAFTEGRYQQGLDSQHLTETELRARMQSLLEDQAWIESAMAAQTQIPESESRAWFAQHRAQLKALPVTRAAHLFLSSHDPSQPDRQRRILKLSAQAHDAAGPSFEQLVEENSEDDRTKQRGGDLGWFGKDRMPASFIAAADKLKPGQISGPVQTPIGWHLIKLLDRKPARDLTFEEVRPEIEALLAQQRREAALAALLSRLRNQAKVVQYDELLRATAPAE